MNAGDLVFCHGNDFIGRLIRFGEWLRWRKGSKWNHVAILGHPEGDDWVLIQALGRGVVEAGLLSQVGEHEVVPLPAGTDAAKVLAFARAQIGTKYGFLTAISVAVTILTPIFINVMRPNTWICSALAGESLRFGGWLHNCPTSTRPPPPSSTWPPPKGALWLTCPQHQRTRRSTLSWSPRRPTTSRSTPRPPGQPGRTK